MTRGRRTKIARGIYRDAYGIAAIVVVGAERRENRWPPDTALREIKKWQDDTRYELRRLGARRSRGAFEADVDDYLAAVKATFANPRSYAERKRDLEEWVDLFRGRRRSTIKLAEVNAQLYAWRETLAASTVNHRLDALSNFFAVLDPGRPSPIAGAVRFKRPPRARRWRALPEIDRVLDALSPGKTRARCRLMRWTGMRPSQMARLSDASHFALDVDPPFVLVPEGKGGRATATPLTPEGADAAREFLAVKAFGSWSTTSATRLLTEAAAALDPPVARFTVYQIRHSFLRRVRELGADLDDVRELAGHTDARTTAIYAPVVDEKLVRAVMRLSNRPAAPAPAAAEEADPIAARDRVG